MQLAVQTSTHFWKSEKPSHSVHLSVMILKNAPLLTMALVGHSAAQSPQAVHSSELIFIAMIISSVRGKG